MFFFTYKGNNMETKVISLTSKNLTKNMEIVVYGHYGCAIILFPTFSDDELENEREGLLDSIAQYIKNGKCKVYSIPAVNFESWLSPDLPPEEKSKRHYEYDKFVSDEVVPFIYQDCGGPVPIFTAGAAIGAYHSANSYFKRPDLFLGVIAMSGTYNIMHFSQGYFDENCYFNSPIHYLPNLMDNYWLSFLKSRHHVYIASGTGDGEFPENSSHLGEILSFKGIPHQIDLWGAEWGHNFDTWKAMLAHFIGTKI